MIGNAELSRERAGRIPFASRLQAISSGQVLCTLLLVLIAVISVYPMIQIVLQSFQVSRPGEDVRWALDGWQSVLNDKSLQTAAWNTVTVSFTRQAIAMVVAVAIAWILARTDIPGGHVFEFLFWIAFFFPALTVTLGWVFLLDPRFGVINQFLANTGLTARGIGPFNIFSFWGIVWAHLAGTSIAIRVMLLTPVFRNMNSSFEEASRVAGASSFKTITKIFVPIMLPAIVAVEFLALLRSLEAFEIEQILGAPIRFFVASTWIYDNLAQVRPRFDSVAALAVVMIGVGLSFVALQRAIVGNRRYTTITGQFQGNVVKLGRMRWVAFAFLCLVCFIIVVVPIFSASLATFMKKFGFFTVDPWTLNNWNTAFNDKLLIRALQNTLILATSTAIGSLILFSVVAYVITRTKFWGRSYLDYFSWLPFTVPGLLLSVALLTMFLQPVARPLYGTMFTLVFSIMISTMPFAVQNMKGAFGQLSQELEEASFITGGTWWHTYRRIVLPLISPTLVVIGIISFISAGRNISQVALLSNSAIRPLSIMQLDYISEGKYEVAAVIATILLLMSLGLALLARRFGYKGVS